MPIHHHTDEPRNGVRGMAENGELGDITGQCPALCKAQMVDVPAGFLDASQTRMSGDDLT